MNISYRAQIDEIDDKIVELFTQRMNVASQIADYKKSEGLPILDAKREQEKLQDVADKSPEELKDYTRLLYSQLFELSRSYQRSRMGYDNELNSRIKNAIENSPKMLPESPVVAVQGTEGAYSHQACSKLFKHPNILFFRSFGDVFQAVEKGICRYGVIPIENSTVGSVDQVYDLMLDHKFSIVRSTRIKIDHNLVVKPGVDISEIKTIYSHQQAIGQCAGFLSTLKGVSVVPCENTAIAAKKVADSKDRTIAALASRECLKYYDLECIKESVQDKGNNYTRFICISKELEILPGAERTSLMATLPHKPGALYNVLSRINSLEININKLESRPLPDRDFEFMFYFDLVAPVYSDKLLQLLYELEDVCERFHYLGSYSEVI